MKNSVVDVVIVNWNAGILLKECIDSIIRHKNSNIGSVIVVDNASTDSSMSLLPKDKNYIKLVYEEVNNGFGKACNIGARQTSSEYILFLNPDTVINESSINGAIDLMTKESSSNIGICGVQLKDDNGISASCSRFPSITNITCSSFGLSKLLPRLGAPMNDFSHETTKEVDQVMGAFFFIRSDLFKRCHGFDERFFVYYEEVDLSKRVNDLGYKSIFLAEYSAYHLGGGVSHQVKAKRLFYSLRSKSLYSKKHFSYFNYLFVCLLIYSIEFISRITFSLLRLDFRAVFETLSAYKMLLMWSLKR